MFNRKKRAVPSVLLASVLFFSAGVPAYADDASGSEEVSVEATKETPAEAPAEETKKAEEPPAPVEEAPAAPVVPVVPDPVVIAPAPPVEPAPAPVVPEPVVVPVPAVPAAPVAPPVETPVTPELPAAPTKEVVIDDPAPVVVAPPAEAETLPGDPAPVEDATPVVNVSVMITTEKEINAQGWIFFSVTTQNVAPGTDVGTYQVNLTGAESQFADRATLIVGEDGTTSQTLYWQCATPGATISITGPDGLMPIFNEITGTTATVQTLPILGTPGCGTTTPTKEIKYVTPEAPKFNSAGEGVRGSVELPSTVGVVYTVDPAGATEGPVKVTAAAAPETADTIYVIAPGAQTEWSGDLGEFIDVVPNPGSDPNYPTGTFVSSGDGILTPGKGPFNRPDTVILHVSGHNAADGSIKVVEQKFTDVDGTTRVVAKIDMSGFCGTVQWAWLSETATQFGSSRTMLFNDGVNVSACDPSKWDDEDDNEHPEQPPAHPWHPGHGHGHHHNGGWNGHAGGPDFNGPTGTPGDLSNNVGVEADSSANTAVVQASSGEVLGMGSALPDVSYWSNDSDFVEDELAATGLNMPLAAAVTAIVILLALGVVAYRFGTRRRPKHRLA